MSKIIGVIYPILPRFVKRIFDDNRSVFVKYVAHPNYLRTGVRKILFYESQGNKEIVGEARIKTNEFLTPLEALQKYLNKIFLDKDELMEYASSRPSRTLSRKMLVLVLTKPVKYSKGIKYEKPITMAGKYLTEEDYDLLMLQNK